MEETQIAVPSTGSNGKDPAGVILSVDQILNAQDIEEKKVYIEEWGGSLVIQSITKAQQIRIRNRCMNKRTGEPDNNKFEKLLWCEAVVQPRFTPAQYDAMSDKSSHIINRILRQILILGGLDDRSREVAERSFLSGSE